MTSFRDDESRPSPVDTLRGKPGPYLLILLEVAGADAPGIAGRAVQPPTGSSGQNLPERDDRHADISFAFPTSLVRRGSVGNVVRLAMGWVKGQNVTLGGLVGGRCRATCGRQRPFGGAGGLTRVVGLNLELLTGNHVDPLLVVRLPLRIAQLDGMAAGA